MPASTFPTTVPPSRSSPGQEVQFDILEAEFGDGYVMRSGAGINPKRLSWSLTFENVDNSDADAIVAFLDATYGYTPFYWTAPRSAEEAAAAAAAAAESGQPEVLLLWIIDGGYAVSAINALSKTITVKFKRWFGATPA